MYPILIGVLAAPVAAGLSVLVLYAVLTRFMGENQGRRGLLAGAIGLPLGVLAGFAAGHTLGCGLRDGGAGLLSRTLSGLALGTLTSALTLVLGVIVGVRIAERRGVTNYAGERAAWAWCYVALPAAVTMFMLAFVLGRSLVE